MPMDPAGGPYAWRPELTQEERARRLDAALAKVPFVQGLNNHEGSRMTAVRPAMAWLAEELQRRGLYLVDSRTSAATVAASEAQRIGLASVSRDVFLDNEATPEAVSAQLQAGVALARKQGSALLIGHPHKATLDVLARSCRSCAPRASSWYRRRCSSASAATATSTHARRRTEAGFTGVAAAVKVTSSSFLHGRTDGPPFLPCPCSPPPCWSQARFPSVSSGSSPAPSSR